MPPPKQWANEALMLTPCRHDDARERIVEFENWLKTVPQAVLPLRHLFLPPSIYIRQMFLQAGTALTGAVHKDEHVFVLMSGQLAIYGEHGEGLIEGPFVMVSKKGAKRVGYAHTDCFLMSVHNTPLTTVEEIERELWVETYEEYECWLNSQSSAEPSAGLTVN